MVGFGDVVDMTVGGEAGEEDKVGGLPPGVDEVRVEVLGWIEFEVAAQGCRCSTTGGGPGCL